jgi:uncharacterized protein
MRRLIVWRGLEEWHAEVAEVHFQADRLEARGTQLGADPRPYRLDYELTTTERWVTERLSLTGHDGEGERRLDLRRTADGGWTADAEPRPDLDGALDCDLAFSPLTNAMPVLRERLREGGGPVDLEMAWVSVPDLKIHRSPQRYEPIDERTVRFVSRDSDFTAEIEFGDDGLVVRYPGIAERL